MGSTVELLDQIEALDDDEFRYLLQEVRDNARTRGITVKIS